MSRFTKHIFICTNDRGPGHPKGSCGQRGADEVRLAFVEEMARVGLKAEMRPNKSGCLDACEHGVTVVVYPEGIWYGKVQKTDVPEIVASHLQGGVPVERLRIFAGAAPSQPSATVKLGKVGKS